MAVGGSTVGEVRGATGNDSNGGFFCPSVSGVGLDYTQQATAQASGTDLACTGSATAVVTSASALFTSNMVGNAIQVSGGTNFTAGFYVILTYTSATQVTLDRT